MITLHPNLRGLDLMRPKVRLPGIPAPCLSIRSCHPSPLQEPSRHNGGPWQKHWMNSSQTRAYGRLPKNHPEPNDKPIPMFEQLFPRWTAKRPDRVPNALSNEREIDNDVVSELQENSSWLDKLPAWDAKCERGQVRAMPTMILVRNGNKNTLPSDFYRVVKGTHLDGRGWSMMQVFQARRPVTAEPLDTYFLLFPSLSYAVAYKKNVLSHFSPQSRDADHQGLFTIAPPDRSNMTLFLVHGDGRIRSRFMSLGQPDFMRQQPQTQHLVAIKLHGGQLSLNRLGKLIEQDGIDRNLAWKLRTSWGLGGIALTASGERPTAQKDDSTKSGLLNFTVRRNGDEQKKSADGQDGRTERELFDFTVRRNGNEKGQLAGASWGLRGKALTARSESPTAQKDVSTEGGLPNVAVRRNGYEKGGKSADSFASRFFLSFQTVDEARRFARQWHKRSLLLKDSRLSMVNTTLFSG